MRRYLLLTVFYIVILSCKESKEKFSDYSEDELYEVQGIITKLTRTSSSFDSSNMKVMNYIYHLDYEIPLEGVENNYSLVYREGTPIVVLVSKEDPKISFFSHIGRINSRLKIDDEINESDTIVKDGVKLFRIESNGSN